MQTRSCADGKDEVVPVLSATFTTEDFLVEAAAHGADGACVASQHGGNVFRGNAQFDEQAGLILQFGHGVKAAQLTGEAGIDGLQVVLHLLPVLVLHQLATGDAPVQGCVVIGGKELALHGHHNLTNCLWTVLLHFLNLTELQLQLAFGFAVGDGQMCGQQCRKNDKGRDDDEPLEGSFLLSLLSRKDIAVCGSAD